MKGSIGGRPREVIEESVEQGGTHGMVPFAGARLIANRGGSWKMQAKLEKGLLQRSGNYNAPPANCLELRHQMSLQKLSAMSEESRVGVRTSRTTKGVGVN